MNALTMPER